MNHSEDEVMNGTEGNKKVVNKTRLTYAVRLEKGDIEERPQNEYSTGSVKSKSNDFKLDADTTFDSKEKARAVHSEFEHPKREKMTNTASLDALLLSDTYAAYRDKALSRHDHMVNVTKKLDKFVSYAAHRGKTVRRHDHMVNVTKKLDKFVSSDAYTTHRGKTVRRHDHMVNVTKKLDKYVSSDAYAARYLEKMRAKGEIEKSKANIKTYFESISPDKGKKYQEESIEKERILQKRERRRILTMLEKPKSASKHTESYSYRNALKMENIQRKLATERGIFYEHNTSKSDFRVKLDTQNTKIKLQSERGLIKEEDIRLSNTEDAVNNPISRNINSLERKEKIKETSSDINKNRFEPQEGKLSLSSKTKTNTIRSRLKKQQIYVPLNNETNINKKAQNRKTQSYSMHPNLSENRNETKCYIANEIKKFPLALGDAQGLGYRDIHKKNRAEREALWYIKTTPIESNIIEGAKEQTFNFVDRQQRLEFFLKITLAQRERFTAVAESDDSNENKLNSLLDFENTGKKCNFNSVVGYEKTKDDRATETIGLKLENGLKCSIVNTKGSWKVIVVDQVENNIVDEWLRSKIDLALTKNDLKKLIVLNKIGVHKCPSGLGNSLIVSLYGEGLTSKKDENEDNIEDLEELEVAVATRIFQRMLVKKVKEEYSKGIVKLGEYQSQHGQNTLLAHGSVSGVQEIVSINGIINGENENVRTRERSTDSSRESPKQELLPKSPIKDEVKLAVTNKVQEIEAVSNDVERKIEALRKRTIVRLEHLKVSNIKKIPKSITSARKVSLSTLLKWYPSQVPNLDSNAKIVLKNDMKRKFDKLIYKYPNNWYFERMLLYLICGGTFYSTLLSRKDPSEWEKESYMVDIVYAAATSEANRILLYNSLERTLRSLVDRQKIDFLIGLRRIQNRETIEYINMKELLSHINEIKDSAERREFFMTYSPVDSIQKLKVKWLTRVTAKDTDKESDEEDLKQLKEELYQLVCSCKWSTDMTLLFTNLVENTKAAIKNAIEFLTFVKLLPSLNKVEVVVYKQFVSLSETEENQKLPFDEIKQKLMLKILIEEVRDFLDETDGDRFQHEVGMQLKTHFNIFKDICKYLVGILKNGVDITSKLKNLIDALEIQNNFLYDKKSAVDAIRGCATENIQLWHQKCHSKLVSESFGKEERASYKGVAEHVFNSLDSSKLQNSFTNNDLLEACERIDSMMKSYCNSRVYLSQNFKEMINSELKRATSLNDENQRREIKIGVIAAAVFYTYSFYPRVTQLIALYTIVSRRSEVGILAKMKTGEGKSILINMLAVYYATEGKFVDIVTTSEELVEQATSKRNMKFYDLFKLSVDNNTSSRSIDDQREVYRKRVLFGTAEVFQADFLRHDFLRQGIRANRKFNVIIVDEADSLLYDQRANTVRLSSVSPMMDELHIALALIWSYVSSAVDANYFGDKYLSNLNLATNVEKQALVYFKDVFYSAGDNDTKKEVSIEVPKHLKSFCISQLKRWIRNAIYAKLYFKKNQHYQVKDGGKIYPIDYKNTGVIMKNSVWENGLAQFIQMNEGVRITPEMISTNYISKTKYFKKYCTKYYNSIIGLTGTLGNEDTRNFLIDLYNVTTFEIPSYKTIPIYRNDDSIYSCKEYTPRVYHYGQDWKDAICRSCILEASIDRAVLAIFQFVEQVNEIEKVLKEQVNELEKVLKEQANKTGKVPKEQVKRKPIRIIRYTEAGELSSDVIDKRTIILSTNIAGRGTDLKTTRELENAGGLHVCITFLPENERVESQNTGRTARAGKKGSAQLIVYNPKSMDMNDLKEERDNNQNNMFAQAKKELALIDDRDELFFLYCGYQDGLVNDDPTIDKAALLERLNKSFIPKYASFRDSLESEYERWCKEEVNKQIENNRKKSKNLNSFIRLLKQSKDYEETFKQEYNKLVKEGKIRSKKVFNWKSILNWDPWKRERVYKSLFGKKKNEMIDAIRPSVCHMKTYKEFERDRTKKFKEDFLSSYQRELPKDVIIEFMYDMEPVKINANQTDTISESNVVAEHDIVALQEVWGFWLKQNLNEGESPRDNSDLSEKRDDMKSSSVVINKFKKFEHKLGDKFKRQEIIENPVYYIRKGNNELITNPVAAQEYYTRAVNMDAEYGLYAYYYRAISFCFSLASEQTSIEKALEDFEKALHLIKTVYVPRILQLETILLLSRKNISNTGTSQHNLHKITILTKFGDHIRENIEKLKKTINMGEKLKIGSVSSYQYFEEKTDVDSAAIRDVSVNGLEYIYVISKKYDEPIDYGRSVSLVSISHISTSLLMKEAYKNGNLFPSIDHIKNCVEEVFKIVEDHDISLKVCQDWNIKDAVHKATVSTFEARLDAKSLFDTKEDSQIASKNRTKESFTLEDKLRKTVSERYKLLASNFSLEYLRPYQAHCSKFIETFFKELFANAITNNKLLRLLYIHAFNVSESKTIAKMVFSTYKLKKAEGIASQYEIHENMELFKNSKLVLWKVMQNLMSIKPNYETFSKEAIEAFDTKILESQTEKMFLYWKKIILQDRQVADFFEMIEERQALRETAIHKLGTFFISDTCIAHRDEVARRWDHMVETTKKMKNFIESDTYAVHRNEALRRWNHMIDATDKVHIFVKSNIFAAHRNEALRRHDHNTAVKDEMNKFVLSKDYEIGLNYLKAREQLRKNIENYKAHLNSHFVGVSRAEGKKYKEETIEREKILIKRERHRVRSKIENEIKGTKPIESYRYRNSLKMKNLDRKLAKERGICIEYNKEEYDMKIEQNFLEIANNKSIGYATGAQQEVEYSKIPQKVSNRIDDINDVEEVPIKLKQENKPFEEKLKETKNKKLLSADDNGGTNHISTEQKKKTMGTKIFDAFRKIGKGNKTKDT